MMDPTTQDYGPKILAFLAPDVPVQGLKEPLETYGYRFEVIYHVDALWPALTAPDTSMVIAQLEALETQVTAPHLYQYMQSIHSNAPLLYLGNATDLDARLYAARSGASAYLPGIPDPHTLLETIEELRTLESPTGYRILIIEDSPLQARSVDAILQAQGMHTRILHNPQETLITLDHFQPDLILTDLYMPYCTGLELARVIRQQIRFANIPIVFLSLDHALDTHLNALDTGADDFLIKPVQPHHLIRTIRARIQRAKKIQALMEQDSLTGLLNHAAILEKLRIEKLRSLREHTPLTFAMLDIDHFKQINDRYGHAMGDHVLKSLSYFLQNRLRKTDSIGRYGGEEFVLILPHTTQQQATQLLDTMRHDFSRIPFYCNGQDFNLTFSIGIAELDLNNPGNNLPSIADKRLYKAKNQGRNRVVAQ